MPRYTALLRAINVGGHTVKMDTLRQILADGGFSGVETFIASGNVIFDSPSLDVQALEAQFEALLKAALGYEVATFIRTGSELRGLVDKPPLPEELMAGYQAHNVGFLKNELSDESRERLMKLETAIDRFFVQGREVIWLCNTKQSESTFSNVAMEKAIAGKTTFRGISTIRKLVEKFYRD